jgi:hypothetical protein
MESSGRALPASGSLVDGQLAACFRCTEVDMSARMERTVGLALALVVAAEIVAGIAAELFLAW